MLRLLLMRSVLAGILVSSPVLADLPGRWYGLFKDGEDEAMVHLLLGRGGNFEMVASSRVWMDEVMVDITMTVAGSWTATDRQLFLEAESFSLQMGNELLPLGMETLGFPEEPFHYQLEGDTLIVLNLFGEGETLVLQRLKETEPTAVKAKSGEVSSQWWSSRGQPRGPYLLERSCPTSRCGRWWLIEFQTETLPEL